MLSRRNIRVKVMQGLYTLSQDKELTYREAVTHYRASVNQAFDLYLFNLFLLCRIAAYARVDAKRKADKLVPTEIDKAFLPKLADNNLIRNLLENVDFLRLIKMRKIDNYIEVDDIRRFYKEYAKTDSYKEYLTKPCTDQDHKNILLEIYKFWSSEESFNDLMESHFPAWLDDKSLIVGSIKKTIKAMPLEFDFYESYRPAKDAVVDFGEVLLHKVYHENDKLLEVIKPTLNNWDVERVAIIDMISLKMAVSELTSFPTIPTKVTLNEFVEISKLYSTDKSKDFINGVLDRLMKDLLTKGLINKEGRGLVG